ncbi:MAG: hypothetical protein H7Z40_06910 [Phycisphaerae bacterium]|nr:hypothetical protein [Gemmatimonadaceae bacterium]
MSKLLRSVIPVAAAHLCAAMFFSACATGGASSTNAGTASPPSGTAPTGGGGVGPVSTTITRWPVKSAAHIDLWLHSFAMISRDTTAVPLFKRGYRDSVALVRSRSNVLTSLDVNREALARRLATNPALVQAQFLALQFMNFADMRRGIEVFLQFEGDPARAPDQNTALVVQQLAASFPTAADRDFIRLFLAGVIDEQTRYYDAEYQRVLRARSGVVSSVESMWQNTYRQKFDRFLTNTSQRQGEMYLSLPIGPEGRTSGGANGQTIVAVAFPERTADAAQALYVFAHEVTGNLVATVVTDNTTPAEQRDGSSGSYVAFGQVVGGLLLLQKIAPELADGYSRYYLAQVGRPTNTANVQAALRAAFPLPRAIGDGLARQIEIVLAGI